MASYYVIVFIYINLIYSGTCSLYNQSYESIVLADTKVITPILIGRNIFELKWNIEEFGGIGDYNVTVIGLCEVQHTCGADPECIFSSVDHQGDTCSNLNFPNITTCQELTVSITKGGPPGEITFNLAPGLDDKPFKPELSLAPSKASVNWTNPDTAVYNITCATRARVDLQVGADSKWVIGDPFDISLGEKKTLDLPLDNCLQDELSVSAKVVYLTLTGNYTTDRVSAKVKKTKEFTAVGVTTVTSEVLAESCSLNVSWVVDCDQADHYIVAWDGGQQEVEAPNITYNTDGLNAGSYEVSVQAYWNEGNLLGNSIKSGSKDILAKDPGAPVVKSVEGDDTTPKKLTVTWEAPTKPVCAGDVTGYTIKCGDGPYVDDANVTSPYVLTCPEACTEYEVIVAATWSGGNGVFRNSSGTTGSQDPDAPTKIVGTTDPSSIALSWTEPDTSNSCSLSNYTVKWVPGDGDGSGGTHDDVAVTDTPTDTITGLTCNNNYTVTVTATTTDAKTSSDKKIIKTDDKVPGAPSVDSVSSGDDITKLTVKMSGPADYDCTGGLGDYKVTWTAVEGDSSKDDTADVAETETETFYTIEGLVHCTKYTVKVEARSNNGEFVSKGDTMTNTTTADPPGKPSVTEPTVTAESVALSWEPTEAKSCELAGYTVNWTPPDGEYNGEYDAGMNGTYTIKGLTCNKDYTVNVTVRADDDQINPSEKKSIKTNDKVPGATDAPVVSPVEDNPNQLIVTWSPPTYACTGSSRGDYSVNWEAGVDDNPSNTADVPDTPYNITGLVPCSTYTVTVSGRSNMGLLGDPGTGTADTTVAVPGISTDISRKSFTPESLDMTWSPPPTTISEGGNPCSITKYTVEWSNSNDGTEQGSDETTNPSLNITGLAACTDYDITVTAYTTRGAGDPIEAKNFTTGVDAPPVGKDNVTITPTSRDAEVTWDRPDTSCVLEFNVTHSGETMWTNNQTTDPGYFQKIADPKHNAFLHNLLPFSEYDVCVTVINGNTTCNTNTTEEDFPSPPREISVKEGSITEVSLTLEWQYPEAENGILLEYLVSWELKGETTSNYTESVLANITSYPISNLDEGTYIFKVIAVNSKGNSMWSETIEQWMDGPSPACGGGCIAGIVIGILLVALAIPAFIFRDRIKEKIKPGSPPVEESPYELRGAATLKTHFRQHVEELGLDRAESVYQMLNDESQQKDKFAATKPFNKGKNRFANIHPFDQTRVKLTLMRNGPKGSDYINANHITFPDTFELQFIATQGPLDSTINDFWRMIWEHNVYDAVMLCNLFEKGKSKCAQYWTESGERSMEIGEFKISCQAEEEDESKTFITRYIDVFKDGQHRMVKQHHFLAWPDFGVPENEEGLLRFLAFVKQNANQHGKKVLTHCSAGVGRTGTFIALWVLTSLLHQNKAAKSIDVHKIAMMMREGRSDMIQTKDQYLYLHKCLLKYMEDTGNSFPVSNKDEEEPIYGNLNTGYEQ